VKVSLQEEEVGEEEDSDHNSIPDPSGVALSHRLDSSSAVPWSTSWPPNR